MKISVIIPCYNVERYVERAVASVLGQTHRDLEVICVDDGSSDSTLDLLKQIEKRDPDRVRVIAQTNRGACAARNSGLQIADGIYLQFLDADDVLLPGKIAHQVELAQANVGTDIIVGSSRTFSPEGGLLRTVVQQNGERDPWLELMHQGMNVTSTILWSRSGVTAVNGWQEGLGSSQEYELMFRMLQNGAAVLYDDHVLTDIHKRPSGSITQTDLRMNQVRSIELRAQVLAHVREILQVKDLQPYYQALFDPIRILYPHDRKKALEYYQRLIPDDFIPRTSNATRIGYVLLHKLLGFDRANRLRGWFR